MPRPKKNHAGSIKRRRRLDPFARTLEVAQKRLAKARADYNRYLGKLQALEVEIPHLEAIVAVHEGKPVIETVLDQADDVLSLAREPLTLVPAAPTTRTGPKAASVPPGLMKYLKPVSDLAGMGSIPANTPAAPAGQPAEINEDEFPTL